MNNPFSVAHKYFEQKPEATPEPEPEHPTPESFAASVLSEFEPDEASQIVTLWREILGVSLDPKRVKEHLEGLRRWQSKWL